MDHQVVALMHHLEEARERERKSRLPPGFRFHPTDEELIAHYLLNKVLDSTFSSPAIAHVDLNKSEPWELPGRAKMGEKEWYFFSVRDRKYPTGLRTNRATEGGYWKATGKDREIVSSKTTSLIGMKKTLVFYKGRAPKGDKTNWVMHEFRLAGKFAYHFLSRTSKDEWVISRVFNKSGSGNNGVAVFGGALKKFHTQLNGSGITQYPEPNSPSSASTSLPPLLDSSPFSNAAAVYPGSFSEHVTCFSTTNSFNFAPHFSAFPNLRSLQPPLFSPMARDWQAAEGEAEESRPMVLADVASTMWTF